MVDNVLLDDAVEDVLANEAEVAVNGGESALDKGPAVLVVVVDVGVVVVEVGDGDYGGVGVSKMMRDGKGSIR